MNYIQMAMEQWKQAVAEAYHKCIEKEILKSGAPEPQIEPPKDPSFGDWSTSFALAAAKSIKMPPRTIAEALVAHLELSGTYLEKPLVAGPGFINVKYSSKWYSDVLTAILNEGTQYGRNETRLNRRVMVEFVSANPTGPMTVGNARGGVLGDTLACVLDAAGWDVWREFYLNDAGNQIDNFGKSIHARLLTELGYEAEMPEGGYWGDYIADYARDYLKEHGTQLLNLPVEERERILASFALPRAVSAMRTDLERYGIHFDRWFAESELYESGYVEETVALLTQKGYTYEKDGALWFKATEFGCDKDDVLRRSNGFYTYYAADIAYHRDKFERRGFDTVIDVLGADHHGHTIRFSAGMKALGIEKDRLKFVLMQLVRLMRDGEAVRMSKRTGKAITLSNLLDEIPVDAARFFFNQRQPDTHLEFDMDLAVQNTSDNPVYYVQYAHARICSLEAVLGKPKTGYENALILPVEKEVIRLLARLPEEINLAAKSCEPGRINRYLIDCAQVFHRFYNSCRIKEADEELMNARLSLAFCVRQVLRNGMALLGITAPDKM